MLSNVQFGKLAEELQPTSEDDAGFTIKTTTGHRPTSGHAVALAGPEKTIKPVESVTGSDLEHYAKNHPALRQPGVHMGGWAPGRGQQGHGKAVLDNVRIVKSRKRAIHEMVMENQEAIYHLDSGETIENPYRQRPKSFSEPEGFDRPAFERDVANKYRRAKGRPSLETDIASRTGRG